MKTVLIVDDAELFRTALASACSEAGFEVVGTAADAMTALKLAKAYRPDLVLLDVLMPGMSGLEVVSTLVTDLPGTSVMLLTSSDSVEDLLAGIKAGASGYVTKDTPLAGLVDNMRAVLDGGAVVSPALAVRLFGIVGQLLRTRDVVSTRKPTLTGREIEILSEVADGLTSREIADKLFISENTVKNHVRNVLDKLGLRSRHDAVRYAVREGLLKV